MKSLAIIALVVALIAGAVYWLYPRDGELSPMTVKRQGRDGTVEVLRGDEVIKVVDEEGLEPGDVVRTGRGARAKLRLEGERTALLDGDTTVEVVGGEALEGVSGSVLIEAGDRTSVSFDDVRATSTSGVFRVDRGSASGRAGTYRGEVRVTAPGQEPVALSRFFQTSVAAGRISAPEPYRVDARDAWDRAWLTDVVSLDRRLRKLGSAIAPRAGSAAELLVGFGSFPKNFRHRYVHRRTQDLIVGFAVAHGTPRSTLQSSFRRAFELFDAGAVWGLAATILDARERVVVARLNDAVLAPAVAGTRGGSAPSVEAGAGLGPGTTGGSAGDAPAALEGAGSGDEGDGDGGGSPDPGDSGPSEPPDEPPDDDDGGGGGGGDECTNEIDCILPPLPVPTVSL
jgi:hypothetical protein